jgi:hypothetical protein
VTPEMMTRILIVILKRVTETGEELIRHVGETEYKGKRNTPYT